MMVKVIKENVRMFIAIHWICKRERKALRAFYHEPNLIYIFIQVWVYLWLLRVTSLTHSSQFSMNWCVFFVKRYIIFQHEYRSAAAIFWICFGEMSCTSKTDQLLTFAWKLTPHITKNKKKTKSNGNWPCDLHLVERAIGRQAYFNQKIISKDVL